MQRNKTWKLATGLMVLMLLATPLLAIVPSEVSAASYTISINVFDNDNLGIEDASATLTEVRKATSYPATSDEAGLLAFTPTPGYYRLKVTATDYYDYTYEEIIRFDGLSNVYLGYVNMVEKGAADATVTFNVTSGGNALNGASVTVKYNYSGDLQTIAQGNTDVTGMVDLDLNATSYIAVVKKANYVTKVISFTASDNTTVDVALSASVSYSGTVTVDGAAASSVKVYMVDQDDPLSSPDAKVLTPAVKSSNYFRFDAYPGDFYLVVDASGALAKVSSVTIATATTVSVDLEKQNLQNEESAFAFAADDWNSAVQTKTLTLDCDYTVPGLAYSYLPSIRMQVDLALGDGDGTVNATELAAFEAVMESYGPLDVTTEGIMSVSSVMFISEEDAPNYTVTGLTAAVDSADGFVMQSVANYASESTITNALSSYEAKVTTKVATASMGYTYKMVFPSGDDRYEMVKNVTTSSTISVSGYTTAVVKAGSAAGTATLTVQKSVAPTAAAAIVTGVDAYKVMNGSTLLHYIVAQDTNVTFTASGSSDPNGNPLVYIWDLGDGNTSGEISNVTYVYAYASAEQYTVNLTVKDQAGLMAYQSFDVKVDGVAPTVEAVENVTELGSTIDVDQNTAYTFNSADSYDRLNDSEEEGLIASYKWVWGDGNTTTVLMGENQTVTHTWTSAGEYTLYLNVTDVANHTTSKVVNVTVKDTVSPTVKFSVKLNGTAVTSAKENQTLMFDASTSSDASGIANYTWDFGDGEVGYGKYVNHTYASIDTFTVMLTLTDEAGNVANTTTSLKIESSARPDIRVGTVTFEPDKFTEGERGYIYVNVTNVGTAKAEGIFAQLWKVNLDGTRTGLTDVSVLLVNDTEVTSLEVGETGVIRMQYAFDSKGDYTLQVNVTANNEVSSKMTDNSATVSLEVEEASWKAWLLYGGIFAVIIVVVVLFLFRKKLPMMPSGKKKKESAPPTRKK